MERIVSFLKYVFSNGASTKRENRKQTNFDKELSEYESLKNSKNLISRAIIVRD